ncbi:MAG: S8 family serine peptidase [Pseudomonadota bacterium]
MPRTPTDNLYQNQWYLQRLGGLETIWDDYDGTAVAVGVYDDGIDLDHYDLDDNYDANLEVIINGSRVSGDTVGGNAGHGTAVAGIIGSEWNGTGTVGIAYDASLTGVNIFDGPASVGGGFSTAVDQLTNFDVTNHSWGFTSAYSTSSFISGMATQFETANANGRGGLGTINVKSAGNDNRNTNSEALDASRGTITVAAYDDTGDAAWYSNHGANVLVSAPSNGGVNGQTTTDILGGDGYSSGDYTSGFGGTSGAAPVVSGVIALMLDANQGLGWRDVSTILAYSSTEVGSGVGGSRTADEDHDWFYNNADNWNGGGLHFSEDYGFGAINVFNAVRMAEVWNEFSDRGTTANEDTFSVSITPNDFLADQSSETYNLNVNQSGFTVEYIELTIGLTHSHFGDLQIELISPDGTVTQVKRSDNSNGSAADFGLTWTYGINSFRGEDADGQWQVRVSDNANGDTGTINQISLTFFGEDDNGNDDVFHFTDEYSESVARDASRASVDGANGDDWINAAAVKSNSFIHLANGDGRIDGESFAINDIENVITGDGNDVIRLSNSGDKAWGGRGTDNIQGGNSDDVIRGGHGRDTIVGRDGDDRLFGNVAKDTMRGNSGEDRIFAQNGNDDVHAGADDDYVRGGTGRDTIKGGSGNDLLEGEGHRDQLFGNSGNDTLDGGRGDDSLDGGTGSDVYRFIGDFDDDVITSWDDGFDRIDFSQNTSINSAADISIVDTGGDVLITQLGDPSNTILVQNAAGLISADDMDFV